MLDLVISGCNGHMGRVVEDICIGDPAIRIVAGFDLLGSGERDFPVFSSPAQYTGSADVVIDFSHPSALTALLEWARLHGTALVLATTGYTSEQLSQIDQAAQQLPIFRSANMSLGINLLMDLVRRAASVLGEGFDVEILERHHRRKVDAPSGTALMLADSAAQGLPYQPDYIYERQSVRRPRQAHEIGISSLRGGTIVGEHEVLFAGRDEVIRLCHAAQSREVFANGAVQAAKFLVGKGPGVYDMSQLIQSL